MRIETVKRELFTYDELSEAAQEKARDWWRDGGLNYEWWDFIIDDAKRIGRLLGIDIDKVYFSGFSSQGDGAWFVGEYQYRSGSVQAIKAECPKDKELHRIAETLRDIQRRHFYSLTAAVTHRGNYFHEYCTDINITDDRCEYWQEVSDDTSESLSDVLHDFMHWIYARLESEYEWLNSDQQVAEAIVINECEFTENGEIA